jgi:hypothetical protein
MAMTAEACLERLERALKKDDANRYLFACPKALLFITLFDVRIPLRFRAADQVAFRIRALDLTVEEIKTGEVRYRFAWEKVANLIAGEPETDSGVLFQG